MAVVSLCLTRLLRVCPVSQYTYYVSTIDGRDGGHHRGDWFCLCTNALAPKMGWGGGGMTGEVHKAAAPEASLKPCQAETTILLAHLLQCFFHFFRLLLFFFPSLPPSPYLSHLCFPSLCLPLLYPLIVFWQELLVLLSNLTSARMGQILRWSCLYLAINVKKQKGWKAHSSKSHTQEESLLSTYCRWEGSAWQLSFTCVRAIIKWGNCVCVVFAAAPFGWRCVTVALGFLRREGTPDMARRCQNARPGLCCQLQGASIEPDSSVCHRVTPTHWGRKTRTRTRKVFNWLKCAPLFSHLQAE